MGVVLLTMCTNSSAVKKFELVCEIQSNSNFQFSAIVFKYELQPNRMLSGISSYESDQYKAYNSNYIAFFEIFKFNQSMN